MATWRLFCTKCDWMNGYRIAPTEEKATKRPCPVCGAPVRAQNRAESRRRS